MGRLIFALRSIRSIGGILGTSFLIAGGSMAFIKTSAATIEGPTKLDFSVINPKEWMTGAITPLMEQEIDSSYRAKMEALCLQLQGKLCREMEKMDGRAKFRVDRWERKAGGGGVSCVMEDGAVFEKAGVNISAISGVIGPAAVKSMRERHKEIDMKQDCKFFACGISSVIHPVKPGELVEFSSMISRVIHRRRLSPSFGLVLKPSFRPTYQ
ncbi:unnamed protein product [Calicophoron daubneyi]|uniref:coproporphyrinogen oxidase n=1 Tax=Calicophoron daubneyi TaxID=300641 RepID=A0AAV2TE97_CALDB